LLTTPLAGVDREPALRGLAVIGSYARGAREDSDIDLILLVDDPLKFCATNWPNEIGWTKLEAYPSEL
jgi:hypothetical protein